MDSVASAIEAVEFEIVRRGYEISAVDGFLATIGTDIVALEEQLRHAQVKAAGLEKQVAAIQEREVAAEAAYVAAAGAKQKLLEEAEIRAAAILRQAEKVADRGTAGDDQIRRDAERLLMKAKEQLAAAERERAAAASEAEGRNGRASSRARELIAEAEANAATLLAAAKEEGQTIVTEARRIALETVAASQRDAEDLIAATRLEQREVVEALQALRRAVADMLEHGAQSSERIRVVLSEEGELPGDVAVETPGETAATA